MCFYLQQQPTIFLLFGYGKSLLWLTILGACRGDFVEGCGSDVREGGSADPEFVARFELVDHCFLVSFFSIS
jgi:hypothetical protein